MCLVFCCNIHIDMLQDIASKEFETHVSSASYRRIFPRNRLENA